MSNILRSLVEETLKTMEAGNFQDFCLEFLPIFDNRYRGISRFGHTAGGKTRPGTPDLLLTCSDSSQIAAQCGTEENYWTCPSDIENWKPVADAKKCIKALSNLVEIVLIATREIPTNSPNTKAKVKDILKEASDSLVTLIAREDIGQAISSTLDDSSTKRLLKKYFPEAFQAFLNEEDAQRFRIGRDVASEKAVDSKRLFSLLDKEIQSDVNEEEFKQLIINEIDSLNYRLKPIPSFHGIIRQSVNELPLKYPLGKVWGLIGIPKIGKTLLLLQLSTSWSEFDIHWYDCPPEQDCIKAITADLIQTVIPDGNQEDVLKSKLRFEDALRVAKSLEKPTIFVVDNAENLSEHGLKHLASILLMVKAHELMGNLTLIFASNRKLNVLSAVTGSWIVAPRWDSTELNALLMASEIQLDQTNPQKYLEFLESFSGGHPLYAKALARKHPTVDELLLRQLATAPDPKDENLSREAQELLYEDILTEADSQNLVQRLSILIGHTPEDILDVLRKDVSPQIVKSAKVIIDRVGGAVIEGDSVLGYSVPMVFREIAKQKISDNEKNEVYRATAKTLLIPKEKVLDLGRAASGIFYLLCAKEIDQFYSWTAFLVHNASTSKLSDEKLSAFLEKLAFVNYLTSPNGFARQISHAFTMLTLASAHLKLGEYDLALKNLGKIGIPSIPDSEKLGADSAQSIQIYAVIMKAIIYIQSNIGNPLSAFADIKVKTLFETRAELRAEYLKIFSESILYYPIAELPPVIIQEICRKVEVNDYHDAKWCFDIAGNIGVRAKTEELNISYLDRFFADTDFGRLLRELSRATLLVEIRQSRDAIEAIDKVIDISKNLGLTSQHCWSHLYQVKGDAAYQLEDQLLAGEAYKQGLGLSPTGSFNRAWASWRLGLLNNDQQSLKIAAEEFKSLNRNEFWARACGARGAVLLREGKHYEGVRCFHELISAYFLGDEQEAGPATTIALSHLSRLKNELEGCPIDPSDPLFPQIDTPVYETVLQTAQPRGGPILAFYFLAKTYHLLGKHNDSRESVCKVLEITPSHEKDIYGIPVVLFDFLDILTDPQADRALFRSCVQVAMKYKPLGGTSPLPYISECIFGKADKEFQVDQSKKMLTTLVEVSEELLQVPQADENFWRAEVISRRAKLLKSENKNKLRLKELYLTSLSYAKASKNSAVLIDSSHTLGFELFEVCGSLKELAEYHLIQLEAVEMEDRNFERLTILGNNLFDLWRILTWRRLLATDLNTKKFLMDSSNEMYEAGTPQSLAKPAMILLLAKLFRHSGPGVEWAKAQCSVENLPENILSLLT